MVANTLLALGEPTRFRIVEFLLEQRRSVTEICQFLTMEQPRVSKHLKALRTAGLVSVEQAQRHRLYRLEAAPMKELAEWTQRFRATWDARYAGVDEILEELKGEKGEIR